jgi:predicted ATPase/DNA-binding SARP family transcriptional activator
MALLAVSVLGPLLVLRDALPLDEFRYNKVRGLLVYLSVEASQPHSRLHLCALLWPELPEPAARRNLRQALTQLRRALHEGEAGDHVAAQPLLLSTPDDDVQLDPDQAVAVDAAQFARLLEACDRHAHRSWHTCAACAGRLQAALKLYRGDFLAGFALPDSAPFEEWALLWRERLRQRALSALERLAARAEWCGDLGLAAAYARRQAELDPLNEAAHRAAMRLLALNGEMAAASAQYDQLRRLLASELGLAPEAESVTLHERLHSARSGNDSGSLVGLRRFRPPAFDGPSAPNTLFGRAEALAAVIDRLRDHGVRALTLIGAPGIGKTRLALQAASDLRFDFEDGVHVVELGPVAEAAWVPFAIAQALGVKEQAGTSLAGSLKAHLKNRHTLLVLDNFEHLLEAAGLVAELLAACPAIKLLATSRIPLRIRAEQTFAVTALSEVDARQLFVDRAGAAPPGQAVTARTVPIIAEICRRLDHLPLAIELIAVRARALPLAEVLLQLEHPLSALTSAPRDLPERHHTLRSALAWSYDRLSPAEQLVFRHMGVFAGGATRAAAQAVSLETAPVLPVLEALREASLLQTHAAAEADEARFTLLATLREFALEQLAQRGEAGAARRRHLDYYLALAERAAPALEGPEQSRWLDRLERDHDNLRAALSYARKLEDDSELRLVVALGKFWEVRGYLTEGRRWLSGALARRSQAELPLHGGALALAGTLAYRQGDYEAARTLFEQSLFVGQQLENGQAILQALRRLGIVAHDLGDLALAKSYYEQSLAIAREIGDAHGIAGALNNLGLMAADEADDALARALHLECLPIFRQLGDRLNVGMTLLNLSLAASHQLDYPTAQSLLEESLATFREIGHKWGVALALLNLANLAINQADLGRAQACHQQSLALYRELGDKTMASYPLFGVGQVAYQQGDYQLARSLYRESLAVRYEAGERRPIPRNLEGLGQLERAEGRLERAAQLFGAAEALRQGHAIPLKPNYAAEYQREVAALRAGLGEAAFEQAWAAGRALSAAQAVALAHER